MRTVNLPDGEAVDALGLGTWHLGEQPARRAAELAGLRLALELGYRVIDSAEMYADGEAEALVGEAIADAARAQELDRERLFVVSKVLPHHASRAGTVAACERSLARLRLDRIDLYLLHWRGPHPLAETIDAFEQLRARRLVRHWGVSNFDRGDLEELAALSGGAACATNQVYYSLGERGIEFDVAAWQQARRMPLMAYSPLDEGALVRDAGLRELAGRLQATPAQVALAWLLSRPGVMAIPKAVQARHLRDNLAAADLVLSPDVLAQLDRLFPPPKRRRALAMR